MMRSDQEKGVNASITTKSFVDADAMLPKSNHMVYEIPNIIVLLDRDIKSIWKESIIIKNRMEKIRILTKDALDEIHYEFRDTQAGMKF